ncbi:MAG TPA: radical SAM protein [Candidatus Omnitrophota bacterium]|nr:radical SAM protein [Candidatus Omnitrophota bacterium]HPD84875.1 radical SAM protein [Candidatus Omnitrophota bacterium]HRZ03733.1 radical SAM protein [Candidatus Omnitrophota bacterium]
MPGKFVLLNSAFISQRKDYVQHTEPHLRAGIAILAAVLRKEGLDVSILDPQAEKMTLEQLVEEIRKTNPGYLALPAYTEEIIDAAKIAEEVKKNNPHIVTIVGGQHVTALPHETLKQFPSFDIVCVGEGESTLRSIVQGKALKDINGLAYRSAEGDISVNPPRKDFEDLNTLPFPAWDLYDLKKYSVVPVEPLRGCPFECVFCFRTLGRDVRYKSPQRIIEEIRYGMDNYGFKRFDLKAGTFPLSKPHAMEFCQRFIKEKLNIRWIASTRVNTIDEDLVRAMKESGCDELSLGIESADPKILELCGKGTTPEMAEKVLKICKEVGITNIELNFILGLPFETKESLLKTKKFALKMRRYCSSVNFAILTPFPGTQIYEMARKNQNGFSLKTGDWTAYGKQAGTALGHPNFTQEQLVRYQANFYLAYYLRSPLKAIKLFSLRRMIGFLKKLFV